MAKKFKKGNKKFKNNNHQKQKKERKEKNQIKNKEEEIDNQKESNKADFYLDDEDADLAYDSSELEAESMEENQELEDNSINEDEEMSEHGSELDFKEEDYIPSESEEKDEEKKTQSMTKKDLKKLMDKVSEGSEIYITKFLILVGKLTNPEKEMNLSEDTENVLNQNKVINNIIKYFIKELPDILQLKINTKNEDKNKSNNNLIKAIKNKYKK